MIHLEHPIPNFSWKTGISQMFGVNPAGYKQFGVPGHQGLDYLGDYGSPILASHDGTVTEISYDQGRSRGMGVYLQQWIDVHTMIETVYWHMSSVSVQMGQRVKTGQELGKMGNTGYVFPIPDSQHPYAGTHLHFALTVFKDRKPMFMDYKKFQDPVPFLFKQGDKLPIFLHKDLYLTKRDDQVAWLQTCLALEGLAQDYTPTGYFGNLTSRDVRKFQKNQGITPTWAYCGPKTRSVINNKYSLFVT